MLEGSVNRKQQNQSNKTKATAILNQSFLCSPIIRHRKHKTEETC
jgi:hypothetical protein